MEKEYEFKLNMRDYDLMYRKNDEGVYMHFYKKVPHENVIGTEKEVELCSSDASQMEYCIRKCDNADDTDIFEEYLEEINYILENW